MVNIKRIDDFDLEVVNRKLTDEERKSFSELLIKIKKSKKYIKLMNKLTNNVEEKIQDYFMESLLITPKNIQEFQFMTDLLSKMNMKSSVITIEDKEDFALGELMKVADRSKKISRDHIMNKLRS